MSTAAQGTIRASPRVGACGVGVHQGHAGVTVGRTAPGPQVECLHVRNETSVVTRAAGALLLLAVVLPGQDVIGHLRVTLDDGSRLEIHASGTDSRSTGAVSFGVTVIEPGKHYRFWVRSDSPPALPDGSGSYLPNVPLLIKEASIEIPKDWVLMDARYVGARRKGQGDPFDTWELIGAETVKPVHSRYPAKSRRSHFVDGGHQLWWDVSAPTHVALAPRVDPVLESRIRSFLGMGSEPLAMSALPAKLRNLKRVWAWDRSPFRYGIDDWVMRRFQDRIPWQGTPARWGSVQWGDRWCNHHYDMVAHAIEAHLYGVKGGWLAATRMARKHLQTGIYDSGGHRFARMHVYEKTGGAGQYPGDGARPVDSHEWDTGLICWALISGDPMALAILNRRAKALAAWPPHRVWNGAGGVRQLGWTLRNMRAFTEFGIRDMKAEMASLVAHAIVANEGQQWWRNAYTPKSFAPWMQAVTNVELACALDGPLAGHEQHDAWLEHVRAKVRFQLDRVVTADARSGRVTIPHNVDDFSAGKVTVRYQIAQLAWGIPQLALAASWGFPTAREKLAVAKATVLKRARPYDERGAVGGGPASLKTWASAHQWCAREMLWR